MFNNPKKPPVDKKAKWQTGDTTYSRLLRIMSHRGHPVMKPENKVQDATPKVIDPSSLKKQK